MDDGRQLLYVFHASFCACYILQNKPVATQNVSENEKDGNRVALLLIPVIYFVVASICFVSLLVLAWLTAACHCGNLPSCRRSPIKERKSKSEHAKERTSRRRRRKKNGNSEAFYRCCVPFRFHGRTTCSPATVV